MKTFLKLLLKLAAVAVGLVLLWLVSDWRQKHLLLKEAKRATAAELLLQRKSKRVPHVPPELVERLAATSLTAPDITIIPGDAPPPVGDGTATYQIHYTDPDPPAPLALRMRIDGTNHIILGHWSPTK